MCRNWKHWKQRAKCQNYWENCTSCAVILSIHTLISATRDKSMSVLASHISPLGCNVWLPDEQLSPWTLTTSSCNCLQASDNCACCVDREWCSLNDMTIQRYTVVIRFAGSKQPNVKDHLQLQIPARQAAHLHINFQQL